MSMRNHITAQRRRIAVWVGVCLALAGCNTTVDQDKLLILFEQSHFTGDGFASMANRNLVTRKWTKDITVAIKGTDGFDVAPFRADVGSVLDCYKAQTGIGWAFATPGDPAPEMEIQLFPNSDAVTRKSVPDLFWNTGVPGRVSLDPRNWVCLSREHHGRSGAMEKAQLYVAIRARITSGLSNRE
jgi:hypothetical protein